MSFSFKANLTITYGQRPSHGKSKKAPVRAQPSQHLHNTNPKEALLSSDILAMQRRIREEKRKALSNHFTGKGNQGNGRKLSLAEVQPSDLDGMDLTGLPSDLLEHPEGEGVDYTKSEEKMAQRLLEKRIESKRK